MSANFSAHIPLVYKKQTPWTTIAVSLSYVHILLERRSFIVGGAENSKRTHPISEHIIERFYRS